MNSNEREQMNRRHQRQLKMLNAMGKINRDERRLHTLWLVCGVLTTITIMLSMI